MDEAATNISTAIVMGYLDWARRWSRQPRIPAAELCLYPVESRERQAGHGLLWSGSR